jgi:hypothetical protein
MKAKKITEKKTGEKYKSESPAKKKMELKKTKKKC